MSRQSLAFAGSSTSVRLGHAFVWMVVALFGLIIAYIFAGLAAEGRTLALIGFAALGIPAIVLPVFYVLIDARRLRRGLVRITEDGRLAVEYSALLREPLVLQPGQVRKAVVDEGAGDSESSARFHLPLTESAGNPSPLPALWQSRWARNAAKPPVLTVEALRGRAPNLALLLETPVAAPRTRERDRAAPEPGAPLAALLLHALDPAGAEAALSGLVEFGPLDVADARHVEKLRR